jgi:hypothetical protein
MRTYQKIDEKKHVILKNIGKQTGEKKTIYG